MTAVVAKSAPLSLKQCNDFKPSLQLSDSGLTLSWLLNVLWENCEAFRSAIANGVVLDVTCNDISEGKGYLSKVYETVLTLQNSGADSFTVMVPCKEVNEKFVEKSMGDVPIENKTSLRDVYECHNIECEMLENLRMTYVPLPLPTVWYTQPATSDTIGAILMADLSVDNVCPGWPYPLTVPQIKEVVRHFAAFHAHQACLGKEETSKWEAACPPRLFWTEEFYNFLHNALRNTPEYEDGEFKRLLHQLSPAMTTAFFRYSLIDRPKQLRLPLVLLHGDAGPHNMFFKKNSDGSASSAFIDWQISFKGNQFFDITRNIYGFADAEARREAEETLLEDYYKVYKDALSMKGRSVTAELDEFREPYALAAVHQALYAAMNPSVLEAKRHEYSPEVFDAVREKFLLRSKLALRDAVEFLKQYAPQFIAE